MSTYLKPIHFESLKEIFVSRFEELILSGTFAIGQKLPSERELALQLGVSRPVVHEGLVDLASKGLVTLRPRVGTIVNDYRREGSPEILESLFNYHNGYLDRNILQSILSMRKLMETEIASLAAKNRTNQHLDELNDLLASEKSLNHSNIEGLTQVDFQFHHLLTLASGNFIYPLLMNSMKRIYTNLSSQFFDNPRVVPAVFKFHCELVAAIAEQNESQASEIMKQILLHGEKRFNELLNRTE